MYAICAFAAIGGGLFGFDISSMSGVLGTNAYKNYFNARAYKARIQHLFLLTRYSQRHPPGRYYCLYARGVLGRRP